MISVETDEGVTSLAYPQVRRDDRFAETLHGVRVKDPYRHLENPESPEVAEFVQAQNSLTQSYLFHCGVDRSQVLAKLKEGYDYPKIGTYQKTGTVYTFFKKEGLQNQAVLYTCDAVGGPTSVLLDPNLFSEDGTRSMGGLAFSPDGSVLAYALSEAGSDWRTVHVRDVASAMDLKDRLEWCKFTSLEWAADGSGFYYVRFPPPPTAASEDDAATLTATTTGPQLRFHRLGDLQEDDALVFACAEDDKLMLGADATRDGEYLLLSLRRGKFNQVWFKRLDGGVSDADGGHAEVKEAAVGPQPAVGGADGDSALLFGFSKLVDNFDAKWELIAAERGEWYFCTNDAAPRYRLVAIDPRRPAREHWREVVPESDRTLGGGDYAKGAHCVAGRLIVKCMNDVKDEVRQYALDGTLERIVPLPGLGVVSDITGRPDHEELFLRFESFLTPPCVYRYAPRTGAMDLVLETTVPGLDTSGFVIEQQFATSRDGTRVPMWVVRAKDLFLDGGSGAVLFGYGGFNVVKTIAFDPVNLALLQLLAADEGPDGQSFWRTATTKLDTQVRGVWALANVRGGGEYGRDWHRAGTGHSKQNSFDDFVACAEWLCAHRYTSPRKLCLHGASNGGLLVAAVTNQRPDLAACVVCQVGLLDMLRFHKFTIGHFWCADYGCPDDAEDFAHIVKYSPYHNVRGGRAHPAMIFTTADRDDRVVPLHTFKAVAQLQHVVGRDRAQIRPILVRVETKAGHGLGTPTDKRLNQMADLFTFVLKALDIRLPKQ